MKILSLICITLCLSFTFLNGQTVVETVSSGTSGDATLKIEADTDNNNESDNPRIEMFQDGGLHGAYIGFNADWGGSTPDNIFRIGTRSGGVNNFNRFVINPSNGNIGINTTNPNAKLDIYGANSNTTNLILAANYIDKYRWRFKTIDRGAAIDMDITASDSNDNEEAVLKLSRSSSGRPEFQLYNNAIVANNGKVGIGTVDLSEKLNIAGNILASSSNTSMKIEGTGTGNYNGGSLILSALGVNTGNNHVSTLFVTHRGTDGNATIEFQRRGAAFGYKGSLLIYRDGYGWDFRTASGVTSAGTSTMFSIKSTGNVGIGTTTPDEKLAVNGNIHTKEVRVDLNGWSDFVFESDYKLPTLLEVEQHIKEKGHLQDIPSAKEVAENGILLGDMNAKLLQKIEELTLYILELKKENVKQDKRIDELIKAIKT